MKFLHQNNLTDQQLVERVLLGDRRAFETVIKNTEALVAQIVIKMLAHAEDRKDVVQDIYMKAFHKMAGFRFQSKLATWIGNIAYNTCVNYLEKKKLLLTGSTGEEEESITGKMNETEMLISQKELTLILADGIDKLSPLYKTLIILYHQQELSYLEITQITGLPEGTVKSYLYRARKMLKENILVQYKKEEL